MVKRKRVVDQIHLGSSAHKLGYACKKPDAFNILTYEEDKSVKVIFLSTLPTGQACSATI